MMSTLNLCNHSGLGRRFSTVMMLTLMRSKGDKRRRAPAQYPYSHDMRTKVLQVDAYASRKKQDADIICRTSFPFSGRKSRRPFDRTTQHCRKPSQCASVNQVRFSSIPRLYSFATGPSPGSSISYAPKLQLEPWLPDAKQHVTSVRDRFASQPLDLCTSPIPVISALILSHKCICLLDYTALRAYIKRDHPSCRP